MKVAEIKFYDWDKVYDFSFEEGLNLKIGDKVIVKTELGLEMGEVKRIKDLEESQQDTKGR